MKRREKMKMESSSDDEDSDVEKNFTLFTQRGGGGGDEEQQRGEDEEEEEDEGDEEEEEEEEKGLEGEEEDEASDDDEDEKDEDDGDDDDEEDEDDDGDSRELQTSDDIKRELSHMSFEDVMKLQNQVGTKVFNEVAHGRTTTRQKTTKRRLNKNRPMEISAKKPAPFLRQVVSVQKTTLRDPRFDDLSGEYKPEIFEKTYKFINDIKQKEKQVVQKQLKKMKKNNNTQKKEKLQFLLKRMENQERARQSEEQRRERELQFKRQQRERANQGARPFFLKKSEKKKLHLAEKYEELKKSGKLENFLSKKRKRNAGKDRRKLPQRPQQHSNAA